MVSVFAKSRQKVRQNVKSSMTNSYVRSILQIKELVMWCFIGNKNVSYHCNHKENYLSMNYLNEQNLKNMQFQ